jgi:hypothetical protein
MSVDERERSDRLSPIGKLPRSDNIDTTPATVRVTHLQAEESPWPARFAIEPHASLAIRVSSLSFFSANRRLLLCDFRALRRHFSIKANELGLIRGHLPFRKNRFDWTLVAARVAVYA